MRCRTSRGNDLRSIRRSSPTAIRRKKRHIGPYACVRNRTAAKSKNPGNRRTQKVAQSGIPFDGPHHRSPGPERISDPGPTRWAHWFALNCSVGSPDSLRSAISSHPFNPSKLSWMDQSSQPNVITSLSLCPSVPHPRGRDTGTLGQQGQERGR
jgi:hypothetical protein